MNRILTVIISLILLSCSAEQGNKNEDIVLSSTTETLYFDVDGGEQRFAVTSSAHFYVLPGERWLSAAKVIKSNNADVEVIVNVEKNLSGKERQARLSVVAGKKIIYVNVIQNGQRADEGEEVTASRLVALSFDDGPNDITTPKVLDILEEFQVPASFFVIGKEINESTAKQMVRAISLGCEIQNHSYTHSFMTKLSSEEVVDELKRTDDLIEKHTGIRPSLFRPPYIDQNKSMHKVLEHTFISGVGCRDWEADHSAQARFEELMKKVQDGDIILLHDFKGNDNTVAALRMIIPELKEKGFGFVTVSQLFEHKGVTPAPHSGYVYTNVLQEDLFQHR